VLSVEGRVRRGEARWRAVCRRKRQEMRQVGRGRRVGHAERGKEGVVAGALARQAERGERKRAECGNRLAREQRVRIDGRGVSAVGADAAWYVARAGTRVMCGSRVL